MSEVKQQPILSTKTTYSTYSTAKSAAPASASASPTGPLTQAEKQALLDSSKRFKDSRPITTDIIGTKNQTFDDYGLKRDLLIGIYSMGFESPTPVQEEAIPIALTDTSLLARAKNGTGKTAAFLIPVLEKIDQTQHFVQAVVMVPTRELAMQTLMTAKEMSKQMSVKIQMLVGGNRLDQDILALKEPGQLIIATVGRLIDLLSHRVIDLSRCSMLIFDEADRLITNDYQQHNEQIISACSKGCQLMLFSATFPQDVRAFQARYMPDARMVNLMEELTLIGLTQFYAYVEERQKVACLDTLFSKLNIHQAMIFCNSVQRVVLLAKKITEMGQSCFYVHAQMPMHQRNRVFVDFRNGLARVLVCSDLLSRGIDIPTVNVVINFDMPKTSETYLHRIGRTGRAGHKGIAIDLITNEDKENLYRIEKELQTEIQPIPAEIDRDLYPAA